MKKALLLALGLCSVALGGLGIFLPLLPTTPFLLLAAYCFARSSPKFHAWLLGHRVLGKYIRDYQDGSLSRATRWQTIAILWLTLGFSAAALQPPLAVYGLLALIGLCVTIHLLTLAPRGRGGERTGRNRGPDAGSPRPHPSADGGQPEASGHVEVKGAGPG